MLALAMCAGVAAGARACAGPLLDFDIPAQPLGQALSQYGAIARQPALAPSALVEGLFSTAVHGRYSAEAALQRLLQGTGLIAEKSVSPYGEVFRLTRPAAIRPPGPAGANPLAGESLDGYPALLQARVLRALCSHARTVPGDYRALFRVQVDAGGQLHRTDLIESTGDPARDAVLVAVLRQVRAGPPPASSVDVPYTMMLLPVAPGARPPCAAGAGSTP
ncbi:STN domain-containing protein [Orrella sp. JC864]|uniref:STN domain-containing protein n=1 Tax=Orrella sp. JC864 TaxID=3120298 RepID=UPI003009E513